MLYTWAFSSVASTTKHDIVFNSLFNAMSHKGVMSFAVSIECCYSMRQRSKPKTDFTQSATAAQVFRAAADREKASNQGIRALYKAAATTSSTAAPTSTTQTKPITQTSAIVTKPAVVSDVKYGAAGNTTTAVKPNASQVS